MRRRTPPLSEHEREAIIRRAVAYGISKTAYELEITPATLQRIARGEPVAIATAALVRSHLEAP
ncbi:MAG: hypothetical protein ACLP1X_05725 [Polyangiaceae bacterium]